MRRALTSQWEPIFTQPHRAEQLLKGCLHESPEDWKRMVRGSGAYVGPDGVTGDHHFLLPEGEQNFYWEPGEYRVEVFGTIVGRRGPHRFWELTVVAHQAIREPDDCTYFDWQPAVGRYKARVLPRRPLPPNHTNMLRDAVVNGENR